MLKEGQMNIPFGMIFSVIIIISIIAAGFYVIRGFVSVSNCAEIGLFYDNLKEYIDEAWRSTIHQDSFPNDKYPAIIPAGIDIICFGDIAQAPQEYNEVRKAFINRNGNVFLYPPKKACDAGLSYLKLEHVKIDRFFCLQVKNNKIELKTEKDQFESLVNLKA